MYFFNILYFWKDNKNEENIRLCKKNLQKLRDDSTSKYIENQKKVIEVMIKFYTRKMKIKYFAKLFQNKKVKKKVYFTSIDQLFLSI